VRGVYLLHLDSRWCGGNHYVGYAHDIAKRVRQHWAGDGALYTRTALRHGMTLHLVRVWPGAGKDVELSIKRQGSGVAYCPWCQAEPRSVGCDASP
jgi:predicted GIY-YIG superfamily endonuclease